MMEEGLLEEVRSVLPYRHLNSLNTVGYKELFKYLDGEWELSFAIDKIKQNSRIYSRKQMTWFKRDEEIKMVPPGTRNGDTSVPPSIFTIIIKIMFKVLFTKILNLTQ